MLLIPDDILTQYEAVLKKRSIPDSRHAGYKNRLRYYLDFCGKYPLPDSKSARMKLFINKLLEKKQTLEQQKHAAHPHQRNWSGSSSFGQHPDPGSGFWGVSKISPPRDRIGKKEILKDLDSLKDRA